MAISVIGARIEAPGRIASPGGRVTHVTQAQTQGGSSMLEIEYALSQDDPYRFANGTQRESRPAEAIGPALKEFSKVLEIVRMPGGGSKPSINIFARAVEPSTGDTQKVPKQSVTIVELGAMPAAAAVRVPGGVTMPAAAAGPMPAAAAGPMPAAAAAPPPADLGKRLRARRKERGMTQREVAKKVGVSSSTISRVERGHEPSGRVRRAIEGFLGG